MNMNLRSALIGQSTLMSVNAANLSDDDAAMLSLDAAQALQEIESGHAALTRLQDTAAATEDTVFIASQITEASNIDLALIDNAINHLGAGEGVSGENVMPNMQNYVGSTVNMQSLRDMASSVWQAIKDLIKRIRDRIVKFFKSRWGDSAKLRKRLKSLIARCEKMSGKTVDEAKTEIGREIKYVTVGGKINTGGKDVLALASTYKDISGALYENWIKNVNEFGAKLESAMSSWEASDDSTKGQLQTLNDEAQLVTLTDENAIKNKFENPVSGDERSPEGVVRKRIDLAGNVSLFAADDFNDGSLSTASEKAKLYAKARIGLESYSPKPKDLEEKGEIQTWTVDVIRDLCNELLSVLDIIDRYDDSKYMKEVDKQVDKVTKEGDKLAKARQKQEDIKPAVDAEAVALQQYASAYTSWTSQGLASFASNFNSFANGVTVIASKCLSNHK